MEKTTKAMGYVVLVLVVTLIFTAIPTECEAAIYEDTIRLHILAQSDSEVDQSTKLAVRDRVLEKYGALLSSAVSIDEADRIVREYKAGIKRDVDDWLFELGENYTAEVDIGREWYDTREYDGFSLPSGYYISLRIILGEGEGQNWWCVMYPPLCLDIATSRVDEYTKEEANLIGGKYIIKFKILEILSKTFRDIK